MRIELTEEEEAQLLVEAKKVELFLSNFSKSGGAEQVKA